MVTNLVSLVENSKANITNKNELIKLLSASNVAVEVRENYLKLQNHKNFQRCGKIVINLSMFNSLKKDIYEYFKDNNHYFNLENDSDFKRLEELLNTSKENTDIPDNNVIIPHEDISIDELESKYPHLYEEYNLKNFKDFSYVEQGRILFDISSKINSLAYISRYIKLSKSSIAKRVKAYKIYSSFSEETVLLKSLSFRSFEAFPSEFTLQKKIIEQLKFDEKKNISREYILNLRNTIDFGEPEKKLNKNLETLKRVFKDKKIKFLSQNEVDRINKHFDEINKILIKNNII